MNTTQQFINLYGAVATLSTANKNL